MEYQVRAVCSCAWRAKRRPFGFCQKLPGRTSLEEASISQFITIHCTEKITGSASLRKCLHQFEVPQLGLLISHYPAEKTNLGWNSHAGSSWLALVQLQTYCSSAKNCTQKVWSFLQIKMVKNRFQHSKTQCLLSKDSRGLYLLHLCVRKNTVFNEFNKYSICDKLK